VAELDKQRLELRSHVLTLREGELDSRLRDRDRTIEDLNLRLRELTGLLHKEQATRESQLQRITTLTAPPSGAERPQGRPRAAQWVRRRAPNNTILARGRPQTRADKTRTPPKKEKKQTPRRAAPLRKSGRRVFRETSVERKRK
jgi:hypothetical protein